MNFHELSGKVVTPCSKEYDDLRKVYNLAVNKFPLAIVYCYTREDVSRAIKWCKKYKVPVRIRTGKHNYEGFSTANGALIIDTTYMNKIYIDTKNDTVKIQAGARLGSIYSALAKKGYGFPGGTCPTVGISGVALGGGIGLSMRLHGLAADNLLEIELIDANGKVIIANSETNPDLYWACRGGGGGNFGVATSFTFKLFKVDKVTLIQLVWTPECREEFLKLWQEWLPTADRRISCFAGFNEERIFLNSFFYGSVEEAKEILKDFLELKVLSPDSQIKLVPFIDAVKAIGSQYGGPEPFQSTGRFVYRPLRDEEIRKLVALVDNSPTLGSGRISFYSLGGAVSDVDCDETAFFFRNAHYIMGITASWEDGEDPEKYKQWLAKGFKYIKTLTSGSYINFPYRRLKDYEAKYYGDNIYKLKEIKRKYDPDNVFTFPQAIKH